MRSGAKRRFQGPLGSVLLLSIVLLPARLLQAQPMLSVTSATVTEPGQMTRICVMLDSKGVVVAGTQNELVWDGTCATIEDPRYACQASPGHGKQLSAAFPPGRDFTLRAFLLSLSDVSPINQRELYCCNVRSELTEPGTSCPINITNVGSSSPDGVALRTQSGGPGEIRYAGSAREPEPVARAPVGSVRPPSAVGGNLDAGPAAAPAAQPAAPAAGGAPASAGGGAPVVLPGGGDRAPEPAPLREDEARAGVPVEAVAPPGTTPAAVPEPPPAAAPDAGSAIERAVPEDVPPPAGMTAPEAVPPAEPVIPAEPAAAEPPAPPVATAAATPAATALPATATAAATRPAAAPPAPSSTSETAGSVPWWIIPLLLLAGVGAALFLRRRARGANQRRS